MPWDITYVIDDEEIVPLEVIMSLLIMFHDFPRLFQTTLSLATDIYGPDMKTQMLQILSKMNVENNLGEDGIISLLRSETSLIPNVEIGHV